jgi:hypothetical protein
VAEDYVRPPIVALPPPDHRMAMWRFRAVMGALLLLLVVIIVLIARAIVHSGDGSGTVGTLRQAPVISLTSTVLTNAAR